MKTLLILLLLLPSIAFAEFTDYEKGEMKKLHDAGVMVGSTFETGIRHQISPYRWASYQTLLRQSTALFLHFYPGNLNRHNIEYPETYNGVIPGRAEIVQTAIQKIDAVISHARSSIEKSFIRKLNECLESCEELQKAVENTQNAIALLESFDRTVTYENPLLPGFPGQFGVRIVDGEIVLVHGHYPTVQRLISESGRILGYAGAHFTFIRDDTAIEANLEFARCSSLAFKQLSRITLLTSNIIVDAKDVGLGTDDRAFRAIDIALNRRLLPTSFGCAISGVSYYGDTKALGSLVGAWRWSDAWVNEFLKIK